MDFENKINNIINLCKKETNIHDFLMKSNKKSLFKLRRYICNNDSPTELERLTKAYESYFKVKSKFLETNEYWKTLTFVEYIVCTDIYEYFKSYMNTIYINLFTIFNLRISWTPQSKFKFNLGKDCPNKLKIIGDIRISPIINSNLKEDCEIGILMKYGKFCGYVNCPYNNFHGFSDGLHLPIQLDINENKDYDMTIYMVLTNKKGKITVIDTKVTSVDKLVCFNDSCSICMEKFNDNELDIVCDKSSDVFITGCGHAFHKECVNEGSEYLFEDDKDKCSKMFSGFKCPNCRVVT